MSKKEDGRLAALSSYHILYLAEKNDFNNTAALAFAVYQTPVALITFLDQDNIIGHFSAGFNRK